MSPSSLNVSVRRCLCGSAVTRRRRDHPGEGEPCGVRLVRVQTVSSALPGYTRNPYDLGRTTAGSSGHRGRGGRELRCGRHRNRYRQFDPRAVVPSGPRRPSSTVGLVSRGRADPARPGARRDRSDDTHSRRCRGRDGRDRRRRSGRSRERTRARTPSGRRYVSALKPDGLRGARIGVLRQLSNTPTTDPEILTLFEAALAVMRDAGAVLVDPAIIPDADKLAQRTPVECRPFRQALGAYLATLGERAPVRSLAQILASGQFHPSLEFRLHLYQDAPNPDENPACRTADRQVADLHAQVRTLLSGQRLDALVIPVGTTRHGCLAT